MLQVKCAAVCTDVKGNPGFYCCKVACTPQQRQNGEHRAAAVRAALAAGYSNVTAVYDDPDRLGICNCDWDAAETTSI